MCQIWHVRIQRIKVVIAKYRFFFRYCYNLAHFVFYASSIHVQSFEIIDHPEFEKISIEKKVEKEVKHRIPYATRKLNYIFPHSK